MTSWKSNDLVINCFGTRVIWLSSDLRFKWFGCQLVWETNDLVVNWFGTLVLWYALVVTWFEIQMMWLSTDLRFKWWIQFSKSMLSQMCRSVSQDSSSMRSSCSVWRETASAIFLRLWRKNKVWTSLGDAFFWGLDHSLRCTKKAVGTRGFMYVHLSLFLGQVGGNLLEGSVGEDRDWKSRVLCVYFICRRKFLPFRFQRVGLLFGWF